ncbi:MAG TPA: hypothetical protein VLI04_01285 [Nocardioidaceae bacterium]|nr:hypothetical protein [Nocardioidaceae bacterium]
MHRHSSILLAFVTTALVCAGGPAVAAPVESGHFHDVFTEAIPDLCGVEGQLDNDVSGSFTFNPRTGLYRESVHGTVVWTNLETGKTFTEAFTANSRDVAFTDNGDGTFTILVYAAGGYHSFDSDGKIFLRDPGTTRFTLLLDDNGTPEDFEDDFVTFLDTVKESTGLNELEGHDFCEDFLTVTS